MSLPKVVVLFLLFCHQTFASEYHPRSTSLVDPLKPAHHEPQNQNVSEHSAHGSLLNQKIVGGGIHDGNKASIQLHNYDTRHGLFFQTQYNGDIVNVVVPEQTENTDGFEWTTPFEPNPEEQMSTETSDLWMSTTDHHETTASMASNPTSKVLWTDTTRTHEMSHETTSAIEMTTRAHQETTTKTHQETTITPKPTHVTVESTSTMPIATNDHTTSAAAATTSVTESKTTRDEKMTPEHKTTMTMVEKTTNVPPTTTENFAIKHPRKREEPKRMGDNPVGYSGTNMAHPSETQAKDFHESHPFSNKAIVQQHFYDGRSGILMQNQYNGDMSGMAPSNDFSAPMGLLMQLLHGRSGLFRGKEGEQKGRPTTSGSSDAQIGIKNTVLTRQHHKEEDQLTNAFGLKPFLSYIRDMVSKDLQQTAADTSAGRQLSEPNQANFMQNLFREGAKNANGARTFMERIMTMMGLNVQSWNEALKDSPPSSDEKTTEQEPTKMTTERQTDTTTEGPSTEITTNSGDMSTITDEDNIRANIRVNSFNVGNGGQAYQIILENPDIKINFVQPEDHTHPTEEPTTTSFDFNWDIFKNQKEQVKFFGNEKKDDDD